MYRVARNFLREFSVADWDFFSVSWKLIFATRTHWFFSLRINFCDFKKYPVPSIDNIFVLVNYVQSGCKRNTYSKSTRVYMRTPIIP